MCREFLAFKYVFIVFSKQNMWLSIFVYQKSWKLALTSFSVHNIHFYLWWQVEYTQGILCYRKIGVKCAYLRFLINKIFCIPESFNTNISHQPFDYTITFVNSQSQHENTNSKGDFGPKKRVDNFVLKVSGIQK